MDINLLKTLGHVKKFDKGDFICVENEEGHTAYLLLQGNVDITLGSFTDSTKKVAQLGPGTIFGEMSLLENKPRNASVVARKNDTLVLEIEKENFLSVLNTDKEIAWNLLCTLLARAEKISQGNKVTHYKAISGYRKNNFYTQLKHMTKDQFESIIEQDGEHALKILKFLSHSLAEMNDELLQRTL